MAQLKKVGFQGERGSFSEVAARTLVGENVQPVPFETFADVFEAVEAGRVTAGVIPIENSLVGSVHINYDLLLEHDLHITGETQIPIVHCLIATPETRFRQITEVYSHPVALDQCRSFFRKNRAIKPVSYYDTAGAVKMLTGSKLTSAAAIAGPLAAEIYDMNVLKRAIQDEKANFTRFLLLRKKPISPRVGAKTSIVFSVKDEPGILFKVLSVFALRDINLMKIESRPVRRKTWQYHFYLDFEGSLKDDVVRNALAHLDEISRFIRILGSYPISTFPDQ